jgi:hypothetical protein
VLLPRRKLAHRIKKILKTQPYDGSGA